MKHARDNHGPVARTHRALRYFAFFAVFGLQACSTTHELLTHNDEVEPITPLSNTPATREALVAIAKGEWQFFGEQQIDMRHDVLSAPRLGMLEDEGEAVQRVAMYWRAVGRRLSGTDCDQAWSAAFISYLMAAGNVPQEQFAPSDVHFTYLSFLQRREKVAHPAFVLRPAASEPIAPGDLLCAPRGTNAASSLDEIRPGLPGHCDMVVEVHPAEGWAAVIGGNVFNSVSASLIPVDARGIAIPVAMRPWFVVAKNRLP